MIAEIRPKRDFQAWTLDGHIGGLISAPRRNPDCFLVSGIPCKVSATQFGHRPVFLVLIDHLPDLG